MPFHPSPHTAGAQRPGRELVLDTLAEHAPSLLATARRYSLCVDDAQDAYQRGLEIFLKHAEGLQAQGAPAWLRTVIKHEALAVRAARLRLVGPVEADMDLQEAREVPDTDERAASFERMERSAEALARLKPQEARALVLKAHGYSYQEICGITGWTYTKVNRCLTEGRRALRERLEDIEAGRECERWSELIAAVADGEARAQDVAALRPHLRRCAACRAALREHRMAHRGIAAVVPLAALDSFAGGVEETPGLLVRLYEALTGGVQERALVSAQRVQAGMEAASAGKVAAVAASATALAGSGVAAVQRPLPAIGAGKPLALKRSEAKRDRQRHDDHPGRERERGRTESNERGRERSPVRDASSRRRESDHPLEDRPAAGEQGSSEFDPSGSGSPAPGAAPAPVPRAVVSRSAPTGGAPPAPSSSFREFGP